MQQCNAAGGPAQCSSSVTPCSSAPYTPTACPDLQQRDTGFLAHPLRCSLHRAACHLLCPCLLPGLHAPPPFFPCPRCRAWQREPVAGAVLRLFASNLTLIESNEALTECCRRVALLASHGCPWEVTPEGVLPAWPHGMRLEAACGRVRGWAGRHSQRWAAMALCRCVAVLQDAASMATSTCGFGPEGAPSGAGMVTWGLRCTHGLFLAILAAGTQPYSGPYSAILRATQLIYPGHSLSSPRCRVSNRQHRPPGTSWRPHHGRLLHGIHQQTSARPQ